MDVGGCGGNGLAGTAPRAFTGDGSSGGNDDGPGAPVSGDAGRRLVRLDDRVEILHCRGEGSGVETTPSAGKPSIVFRPRKAYRHRFWLNHRLGLSCTLKSVCCALLQR